MNINYWESLVKDIVAVYKYAQIEITEDMIDIEKLPAPHEPTPLPKDKMAVYIFFNETDTFKVGKAGPNSTARYQSHHYSPRRATSTLAASIIEDKQLKTIVNRDNVEEWIKKNLSRVNLRLDKNLGIAALSLLESFLHCRLKPKYEGLKNKEDSNGVMENNEP